MTNQISEPTKESKPIGRRIHDAIMDFTVEHPKATAAVAFAAAGLGIAIAGEHNGIAMLSLTSVLLGLVKLTDESQLDKHFKENPGDMPGSNKDGRDSKAFQNRVRDQY